MSTRQQIRVPGHASASCCGGAAGIQHHPTQPHSLHNRPPLQKGGVSYSYVRSSDGLKGEIFILLFQSLLPLLALHLSPVAFTKSVQCSAATAGACTSRTPARRSPARLLRLRVGRDARSTGTVRRRRHPPAYTAPTVAVHDVLQHLLQVLQRVRLLHGS